MSEKKESKTIEVSELLQSISGLEGEVAELKHLKAKLAAARSDNNKLIKRQFESQLAKVNGIIQGISKEVV